MEWKKLPEICDIKTGKKDANYAKENGKYRFYTCANHYSLCDTYSFSGESIIVPGNGDIGLVFYYDGNFEAYQRTYVLSNIKICAKYLYYYFVYKWRSQNTSKQFGSTVKYVRIQNFNDFIVPVPPLPEQQRIVAKIEELFAELDNSVAMLKKVKEQLEVYRQAVLEKAFEIANESVLLREYIEKPTYGTSQKCTYDNKKNSIAVYRIPNISDYGGHIDHSDLKYAVFSNEDKIKYMLKENDILIIRSNGSEDVVGQVALVRNEDINGIFAGYLIRLRIKQDVNLCAKYLFYFLQSFRARQYMISTAKSTNGINNINAEEIQNISIPLCEYDNQIKAVSFIENNLSLCRQLNENISVGLQQTDTLRQSILKKAFEGEL